MGVAHTAWGRVHEVWRDPSAKVAVESPFRLLGQYGDQETGLAYTRYRYFEAESGRWLCPDPIGVAGGKNLFGFDGAPSSASDELGLACKSTRGIGHHLVARFMEALDFAVQHAARVLDAGKTGKTVWGNLYHNVFKGTPLEAMARGNAIQQIAEARMKKSPEARAIEAIEGKISWNQGSVTGNRNPKTGALLRPDVQIVMPDGGVHVGDVTTPGQSAGGKIGKYDAPGVKSMTDTTY